jgi:hypothetical protein
MLDEPLLNRPCGGRFQNLIESIGNTPLVELPRLSPKPGVRIWAKLEGHNPTGSVKDRVAKSMIEDAEDRGAIEPGHTIFEPTSGNTGISLAMICRRKGYPLKVVMPDNVTEERTQLLTMYGAEIVYSEGAKGSNGAVEMALDMAEKDSSYYMPYQYGNEANPLAHYNGTAPEILEELDQISAFVGGLGTGGTLMGNGRSSTSTSWTGRSWSPTTTRSSGPRSCWRRRACSRACPPGRSPTSRTASPASWTRATSCSWFPTTAGSTSPRACTRSRSQSSRGSTPPSGGSPAPDLRRAAGARS